MFSSGRISVLEEEAKQQRQALSKSEGEKRQLQEKLTDLEKVKLWNQDARSPIMGCTYFSTDLFSFVNFLYRRTKDNRLWVSLYTVW